MVFSPNAQRTATRGRAEARPRGGLANHEIGLMLSVGLTTRTEDRGGRPLAGKLPDARLSLGGLYSAGCTLAGAPTWPLWPGAACHVQRGKPLKSAPACLFGRLSTPGCRPDA